MQINKDIMMYNNYKKATIMKVKVCLECKLVMDLGREQQAETSFLSQFDGISLESVDQECPFCGELLERGQCSCKEFKTAYDKLLKSYPEQDLRLVVNDNVRTVSTFPLLKDKLTVTRVPLTDELILLFDNGTIARSIMGSYFVSEGSIEGTDLKFYIRQKRRTEVYECQIKGIDDIPQETKVRLCKFKTKTIPLAKSTRKIVFGGYRIENQQETIAEFGCGAFLARLQELMKDE